MSCHGCSAAFGFLNRERGCPKCGFSYCKKCLRFKITNSETEKGDIYVCVNCNIMANSKSTDDQGKKLNRQLSLSETTQVIKAMHRLQSLENPSKPPIVLYSEQSKEDIDSLREGMTPEDQILVDRLANLRNEQKKRRKSQDPAEDIALRLAQLRGDDPVGTSKLAKINPLLVSKKAETEDDLVARLSNEASLDQRYGENLTADLEERLSRLRQPLKSKNTAEDLSNKIPEECEDGANAVTEETEELTEEEQVQRIIQRFQKEVDLEKSSGVSVTDVAMDDSGEVKLGQSSEDEEEDDDDHFCRICDAKATVACKKCDGDEYCLSCFQEFHKEIGEAHKPSRIAK